jgi:hypothetical protein
MDINVYYNHLQILRGIKRRYSDRKDYPKGVFSDNASSEDKLDYLNAVHYILLYHSSQAEQKAERLKRRTEASQKRLEEFERRLGVGPHNHHL